MTEKKDILRLTAPLSWLDGVDPETGVVTQPGHPQFGQSVAGRVVRMPHSVGSTVGAYGLFKLARHGTAPREIILERPDSVTISAELVGIPVRVLGSAEAPELEVDAEVPEEFVRFLQREASLAGAEGYVRVRSVHISGVSYTTIGEAGLEFLEGLAERGVKVRVLSTSNPAGMDLSRWRDMGVPESFAEKQIRIVNALKRMGVLPTLTCTPYLVGNHPAPGEHVCWGESSAVAFANSVLGARTNREGSVKAIVAAVAGLTPAYGMHSEENRRPTVLVDVDKELEDTTEFSLLGYLVGELYPHAVPLLKGVRNASIDEMKALGAGGAASGSIELFHIEGITPEHHLEPADGAARLSIGKEDLREVEDRLNTTGSSPDLVTLGCPHLSLSEIWHTWSLLRGRRASVPFWLFTARTTLSQLPRDLVRELESAGVKLYADTCMVVAPLREMGFSVVATNSAKAAKYLRTLGKLEVILMPVEELVEKFTVPAG